MQLQIGQSITIRQVLLTQSTYWPRNEALSYVTNVLNYVPSDFCIASITHFSSLHLARIQNSWCSWMRSRSGKRTPPDQQPLIHCTCLPGVISAHVEA